MQSMEASAEPSSNGYAMVLVALGSVLGVLTVRVRHQQKLEQRTAGGEIVVTSDFKSFQATFMSVYLCALLTEWFQAAYLFVLLREYHPEEFVVRMYLAGVASQLSLSVLLEVVGGFIPNKLRCAGCLALQAASACFLLHPAYGGLVMSRVLGGFAAALLHSSFEAWMVEQHVGQGFPLDWFTHTFNTLSVAMSILAVVVGPAVTGAHDFAGGNLGPFKASLLLTAINGCLLFSWRRDANKPCPAFTDMARLGSHAWAALIGGDGSGGGGGGGGGKVALVTLTQACFEAATFAFGLLWTPLLAAAAAGVAEGAQASPPWGLVFSQQLVCVMIGSVLFKLTTALAPRVSAESMCLWASVGGAVCFLGLSTGPSLGGVQSALLGYEVCVGVYLNAMGVMRSKFIPQEVRGLVLAASKLVVTTVLFVLLMYLSEAKSISTGVCGGLLTAAAVCSALVRSGAIDKGEGDAEEEEGVALTSRR